MLKQTPRSRFCCIRFAIKIANVCAIIATTLALPAELGAQDSPGPTRREDVQRLLDTDVKTWEAALPQRRPRLLLSPQAYDALPARYQNATGRERELFDALFVNAERIIKRPLPEYRPPEAMVTPKLSLFAAQEELWMRPVGDDMLTLSLAAQISGDPRFKDYLRQLVMRSCSFPQWGLRPKNAALAAGHMSRGVATAYDWHNDIFSEEQKQTIRNAVRERMADTHNAFYNPRTWSIHYQANWNHVAAGGAGTTGLAFLGEIPEAAEWSAAAWLNFQKVAELNNIDGSTTEGVSYWSYALAYILQYIESVSPVLPSRELYASPFFRNAAAFRLHSATSGFDGTLAYGASVARDYYGPHHFLYRLASQYKDGGAQYLADNLPFAPRGGSDGAALSALWYDPSITPEAPVQLDNHLPVADMVTMRSGWDKSDYLLAIKSGFTNRNHSHLDAGTLTWAFGSQWLIDTPGYGLGGGNPDFWKRASGERWTFFTNATESHSTLLVNGSNQLYDPQARSSVTEFLSLGDQSWTRIDMQRAYADTDSIERAVLHRRGDYALVWDTVTTPQNATLEWLLKVPDSARLSDGNALISGNDGSLEVRPLFPTKTSFTLRTPTSVHVNLPPERLNVFTLKQQGRAMNYLVALLPAFAGKERAVLRVDAQPVGNDSLHVRIEGEGWRDLVQLATAATSAHLRGTLAATGSGIATNTETATAAEASNGKTTGSSKAVRGTQTAEKSTEPGKGEDATLGFVARVASARAIGDAFDSALFSEATEVSTNAWHIHFAAPATLALRRTTENRWQIAIAEPGAQISKLADGYALLSANGAQTFTTGEIPAGEYVLTPRK